MFGRLAAVFMMLGLKGRVRDGGAHEMIKKVAALEERVRVLENRCSEAQDGFDSSLFVVEYLNIEKLLVDKVELNNNIGSVGIRELSGALNIGANYGGGLSAGTDGDGKNPEPSQKNNAECRPAPPPGEKMEQKGPGTGPRLNITYGETRMAGGS